MEIANDQWRRQGKSLLAFRKGVRAVLPEFKKNVIKKKRYLKNDKITDIFDGNNFSDLSFVCTMSKVSRPVISATTVVTSDSKRTRLETGYTIVE